MRGQTDDLETDDFVDPGDLDLGEEVEETDENGGGNNDDGAGDEKPEGGKPAGKKGAGTDDDVHKELRSIRKRLSESEGAARYWYEQAKNGGASRKPAAPEEDDAGGSEPLSVDLVDAISSGDKKLIAKALKEIGFVDEATMQRHMAASRTQGSQEQEIYRQFPDLRDNTSEFFKATQKHYAELVADGSDPNSLGTTKAAAKLARAEQAAEGQRGDRVRRQAGDRGRTPSRGRNDAGNDDDLDSTQLAIIRGFAAAGADVTEEGYRKRASKGVRMSGVRTHRR